MSISEDLLANGTDVEILNLSRIILKRMKSLGVMVEQWRNIGETYLPLQLNACLHTARFTKKKPKNKFH